MGLNRREDSELDDQVRVIELWMEKFKTMRAGTLDNIEGGRGSASDRVVFPNMSHVSVFEGVNQRTSNSPVKEISSDIRTLRDGNGNRGFLVGLVRHTLGRRDSCQW